MPALKKILCALDLSDQSESVAEYAVMLAKMSGASIVAVYAAPTLTQYTGFHVPPNTIDNFVGEIVSGAERSMTDFVSEHFTGVDARGVVVVGYAAEEILALAESEQADIIVMGTRGRKGIDLILFGSVAEKRDLPCADHPSYRRRLIDRGQSGETGLPPFPSLGRNRSVSSFLVFAQRSAPFDRNADRRTSLPESGPAPHALQKNASASWEDVLWLSPAFPPFPENARLRRQMFPCVPRFSAWGVRERVLSLYARHSL